MKLSRRAATLGIAATAFIQQTAKAQTAASPTATRAKIDAAKARIVKLAKSFEGLGDPDFSKQRRLDALIRELLAIAPQPPIAERLSLLYGPWRQVWGPYDYRNDDRGVDPQTKVDEIYQAVFPGGYYWNVSPIVDPDRAVERIALLRGVYRPVPELPNTLRVRFTSYPGNEGRPTDKPLWSLAELAERDALPNRTTIVPSFIVRLFFGGGGLREVYTDETLRITYGASSLEDRSKEALYVMVRADR